MLCLPLYFNGMNLLQRAMAGVGWDQSELLLGQFPTLGAECVQVDTLEKLDKSHAFFFKEVYHELRVWRDGHMTRHMEKEREQKGCASCF